MRKRIIIGLLAVVVIGVVVFFLSQPKEGSVEWHKKRYLTAWKRDNGHDWRSRLGFWLMERANFTLSGLLADGQEMDSLAEEVATHRNALVRLGHLTEVVITFSNRPVTQLSPQIKWPAEPSVDMRFVDFFFNRSGERTNTVVMVAPSTSIKGLEDFCRQLDTPMPEK